jgi:hypothetical protein
VFQDHPGQHYKWDVFFGRSTVRGTKSIGYYDNDDQSKLYGASIFSHHLINAFRQSKEEKMVSVIKIYPN